MFYRDAKNRRRYLLDDFEITYTPSCAILQRCIGRDKAGRAKKRLVAVANPQHDLIVSDWEAYEIERMFPVSQRRVFWHEQANQQAILEEMTQANFLHFSCHGTFDLSSPLESALQLTGAETLSEEGIHAGSVVDVSGQCDPVIYTWTHSPKRNKTYNTLHVVYVQSNGQIREVWADSDHGHKH
jgi:CHAT domain-containing protein